MLFHKIPKVRQQLKDNQTRVIYENDSCVLGQVVFFGIFFGRLGREVFEENKWWNENKNKNFNDVFCS